jgi:hypothetical protein
MGFPPPECGGEGDWADTHPQSRGEAGHLRGDGSREVRRRGQREFSLTTEILKLAGAFDGLLMRIAVEMTKGVALSVTSREWLSVTAGPSTAHRSVEKHFQDGSAELQIPRLRSG